VKRTTAFSDNRDLRHALPHKSVADIWKDVSESTSMMFRQVLDVDKVITQLLAGRNKADKQVSMHTITFAYSSDVLGL
jgi:hypothetical protein